MMVVVAMKTNKKDKKNKSPKVVIKKGSMQKYVIMSEVLGKPKGLR